MKITGGRAKGRILASLKGMDIRPTSSKVREAIFNILGQDMTGIKVLDLFAGTGLLGIEALSRGAEGALFIDKSNKSISIINKNLTSCGYQYVCQVVKKEITEGLQLESLSAKEGIDLVFIDPPYGKGIIPPVLKMLSGCGILAQQAVVVTESFKNDQLPETLETLLLSDTRTYGETKIDIYKREH
jgi:16S rRNA (guanine966-N2)-methyltransferase